MIERVTARRQRLARHLHARGVRPVLEALAAVARRAPTSTRRWRATPACRPTPMLGADVFPAPVVIDGGRSLANVRAPSPGSFRLRGKTYMTAEISDRERLRRTRQSAQSHAEQRAFDIGGFCQRYGVGRTRAYEEIKLGRLRVRKCGRKTLIAEDDAEQWLANLPSLPHAGGGGQS
jgi:hypothetical protein